MRTKPEVEAVLAISARGLNNCQIARETGIPRTTVRGWVNGAAPWLQEHRSKHGGCPRCGSAPTPLPGLLIYSYAYLLGLYLGDGCLLRAPRGVYRLEVYLDRAYPLIAAECAAAMSLAMPGRKATVLACGRSRMYGVTSYSKHWPHLLPQHGPGMKHLRRIALEPWQESIVKAYPGRLLRGLVHSDGCRVTNRIRHPKKTYAYPRYFFSNRSPDIQRIFTDACEMLGVSWRQDGTWNISVARKGSVAIMDRHVGPKR